MLRRRADESECYSFVFSVLYASDVQHVCWVLLSFWHMHSLQALHFERHVPGLQTGCSYIIIEFGGMHGGLHCFVEEACRDPHPFDLPLDLIFIAVNLFCIR